MKKKSSFQSYLLITIFSAVLLFTAACTPEQSDQAHIWSNPMEQGSFADHNLIFPDPGITYWNNRITIPEGSTLQFKGQYPDARYISFTLYDEQTNTPLAHLHGVQIEPDAGSQNPYLADPPLSANKSTYTMSVLTGEAPDQPEPNTLYTGALGDQSIYITYRVYFRDAYEDPTGGVALPEPQLTLANGTVLSGEAVSAALGAEGINIALPDPVATYWHTEISIPEGASLQLKGQFPYSRYMSITAYSETTMAIPVVDLFNVQDKPRLAELYGTAEIHGVQIFADEGSLNPYLSDPQAAPEKRKYTITIAPEDAKPKPEPNTLYTGAGSEQNLLLTYRLYRQDGEDSLTGRVGLPEFYLTLADGTLLTGEAASKALNANNADLRIDHFPRDFFAPINSPAWLISYPTQTEMWSRPVEKGSFHDHNFAFPDHGAAYWSTKITIPKGAELQFKGRYPYARYISLIAYDEMTSTPISALHDSQIEPDEGSINPFLPGAPRHDSNRSYTITILAEEPLDETVTNTLLAGAATEQTLCLMYRIYVPDNGRDLTGGVGLPEPHLRLADGTVLTGEAAIKALNADNTDLPMDLFPPFFYNLLRNEAPLIYDIDTAGWPAQNPPVFQRVFNVPHAVGTNYGPQAAAWAGPAFEAVAEPQLTIAQWSNLDVAYISAPGNFYYGEVLVLRGKMPLTPKTFDRNPAMGEQAELRYWSLTVNESLATTRIYDGVYDEQAILDDEGYYNIVISHPWNRPQNATRTNGITWIAAPPQGNGVSMFPDEIAGPEHPNDFFLIIRNMLDSPDFGHAIQKVMKPADLEATLGPYLPTGSYMSRTEFEAFGSDPIQILAAKGTQ